MAHALNDEVFVAASAGELAAEAARRVGAAAARALAARNRFTLVLAGGSTPRALYRLLADQAETGEGEGLDWARTEVFFGDERCVPPDHPSSNYRQVKEDLLDRLPLRPAAVNRIRGELSPTEAADQYADLLDRRFAGADPVFDLVMLGVGDDGHTASLFPGTEALLEKTRTVVVGEAPVPPVHRVSLTLPVLGLAREVLFVVGGAAKAPVMARILNSSSRTAVGNDPLPPACLVEPKSGSRTWLLDREAASLSGKEIS